MQVQCTTTHKILPKIMVYKQLDRLSVAESWMAMSSLVIQTKSCSEMPFFTDV